jgi:hypothetical protein
LLRVNEMGRLCARHVHIGDDELVGLDTLGVRRGAGGNESSLADEAQEVAAVEELGLVVDLVSLLHCKGDPCSSGSRAFMASVSA